LTTQNEIQSALQTQFLTDSLGGANQERTNCETENKCDFEDEIPLISTDRLGEIGELRELPRYQRTSVFDLKEV
jgi:hypothetical protein